MPLHIRGAIKLLTETIAILAWRNSGYRFGRALDAFEEFMSSSPFVSYHFALEPSYAIIIATDSFGSLIS